MGTHPGVTKNIDINIDSYPISIPISIVPNIVDIDIEIDISLTPATDIRGGGSWFVTAWLVCDAISQPPMSSFSTDSTS